MTAPVTTNTKAQFDRLAYPSSPEARVIPEGRSEGAMVVQMFLNKQAELGESIPVDGLNGDRTQLRVSLYQSKRGLEPTGRVDDATFAQMQADGLNVDQAFMDRKAYTKDKPELEASITEAIYKREVASITGSEAPDAAITLTNPPRVGLAVAAIQHQMNADYERAYTDQGKALPKEYKPLEITGKFDEATQVRLTAWQKDETLHGKDDKGNYVKVPELSYGKFDRATYDACFYDPKSDGTRTGDDYKKNGLDTTRFAADIRDSNSELAQNIGKDKTAELLKLEQSEQARREHAATGSQIKASLGEPAALNIASVASQNFGRMA